MYVMDASTSADWQAFFRLQLPLFALSLPHTMWLRPEDLAEIGLRLTSLRSLACGPLPVSFSSGSSSPSSAESCFASLSSLTSLRCPILSASALAAIASLSSLRSLDLSGSSTLGSRWDSDHIRAVRLLTQIETLNLDNCFEERTCVCLTLFLHASVSAAGHHHPLRVNLRHLNLSAPLLGNGFAGESFACLSFLRSLTLRHVIDKWPVMPALEVLDFGASPHIHAWTRHYDHPEGGSHFRASCFPNLTELYLCFSKFDWSDVAHLTRLKMLDCGGCINLRARDIQSLLLGGLKSLRMIRLPRGYRAVPPLSEDLAQHLVTEIRQFGNLAPLY
jgi:hypothetical protein